MLAVPTLRSTKHQAEWSDAFRNNGGRPLICSLLYVIFQSTRDLKTKVSRGGSRILGKGGSDKYIHNWGRVLEGACPLP